MGWTWLLSILIMPSRPETALLPSHHWTPRTPRPRKIYPVGVIADIPQQPVKEDKPRPFLNWKWACFSEEPIPTSWSALESVPFLLDPVLSSCKSPRAQRNVGVGQTQVSWIIKHAGSSRGQPDPLSFDSSELWQESKYPSAPLIQRSGLPQPLPSGTQLRSRKEAKQASSSGNTSHKAMHFNYV